MSLLSRTENKFTISSNCIRNVVALHFVVRTIADSKLFSRYNNHSSANCPSLLFDFRESRRQARETFDESLTLSTGTRSCRHNSSVSPKKKSLRFLKNLSIPHLHRILFSYRASEANVHSNVSSCKICKQFSNLKKPTHYNPLIYLAITRERKWRKIGARRNHLKFFAIVGDFLVKDLPCISQKLPSFVISDIKEKEWRMCTWTAMR